MKIYRLEYRNIGCYTVFNYTYLNFFRKMVDEHCSTDYPTVFEDFSSIPDLHSYFCACPSAESFYKWFDGYWDNWKRCKLAKVLILEVEDSIVGKSGKQCVFKWEDVISKQEVSVKEFLQNYKKGVHHDS